MIKLVKEEAGNDAGTTTKAGALAEAIAAEYLQLAGYRILARNLRSGRLEVDLIARRRHVIAFIEVRMRRSLRCGRPEETVGVAKRRHLIQAATALAPRFRHHGNDTVRFDVVAILWQGQALTLRHLPGWFGPGEFSR